MALKINSASGSITLTAEDGSGNADVTIPRGGIVSDLTDLSITATATELNYVDGVTSNIQTQLDAKGTASTLGDLGVTATAAELNLLDGVTATTAELNYVDGVTSAIQTQIDGKLATTLKGAANGLAELDSSGLVPTSQLPSYVDDVLEYTNASSFPASGTTGKIYVALDTNDIYRWSGSAYVKVSDAVSISDQATALATARTISLTGDVTGSTSFDGSANVSITATIADDSHNHVISNVDGLQTALDAKAGSLSDLGVTATAAEINTLDGVTATTAELNYVGGVTSAIQTQLDGKLSTSGGTLTGDVNMTFGNLTLNDGRVFYSGTGNDFSINHNGFDTYVSNSTGNLEIKNFANDKDIIFQTDNSIGGTTNYIVCDGSSGAVNLYHYGSSKLYTTSSGVVVSGTLTPTGGIDCNGQLDINEVVELVWTATSTTGTLTFDTQSYGVAYYTADQTANRTINFSNVNSNLTTGQSITSSVLMTQGTTAYYLNAYQVDGTAVTPKWSGGTAPTAGNASGIDVYTFTIIKTADATFTVLASVTQYA